MTEPFRVLFAPGVTPDKWLRIWADRMRGSALEAAQVEEADQTAALRAGQAAMCFVRLPVDRDGLHLIPLYTEVPVVVVPKDHPVAAFDEVDVEDLAEEHLLQDPGAVPEWRALAREVREGTRRAVADMTVQQAIEVVASGAGIVIVPLAVARLHDRKDVVHRPVRGVAETQIGLAWRVDDDDPRIETFVGIVRGRTAASTRGGGQQSAPSPEKKAAAKRAVPKKVPRPRRAPRRRSR